MFIAFYGSSEDWTRIRSSYSNLLAAPRVSPGIFLASSICMIVFWPVGLILYVITITQMCHVINYMASTFAMSKSQSSGLTGTKFY